ncbi:hypothetical protein HNY73_018856 [Argiope bruennichi]|uniref:Uncharacterized protein n=1 Tax=Argiope bruennichi TaxID=94029 RepID=A0A8T0EFN5_ARGBR|nr:hypothetical protein HNY73_018856 [Argiope bruennichi]
MEIKQLSPCLHSERHLIYVNEQKYGIIVENSFHGKFGEKIFQRHSKRIPETVFVLQLGEFSAAVVTTGGFCPYNLVEDIGFLILPTRNHEGCQLIHLLGLLSPIYVCLYGSGRCTSFLEHLPTLAVYAAPGWFLMISKSDTNPIRC